MAGYVFGISFSIRFARNHSLIYNDGCGKGGSCEAFCSPDARDRFLFTCLSHKREK